MARGCGTCTVCCTVMRVAMEPPKPQWTPCRHLCRKGCSIYPDRPEPCRVFDCGWLATQQMGELALPKALRPDKCGAVLEFNTHGNVVVHCQERGRPWERQPLLSLLLSMMSDKTQVIISTPQSDYVLLRNGSTQLLRFLRVDPDSNERVYVVA